MPISIWDAACTAVSKRFLPIDFVYRTGAERSNTCFSDIRDNSASEDTGFEQTTLSLQATYDNAASGNPGTGKSTASSGLKEAAGF